jgi:hypothetical protein
MQTTEVRLCENPADALNVARYRRVLAQRQMGASLVVIYQVRSEQLPKVTLAEHNDMIEYFPPDRANQPFCIGILPG